MNINRKVWLFCLIALACGSVKSGGDLRADQDVVSLVDSMTDLFGEETISVSDGDDIQDVREQPQTSEAYCQNVVFGSGVTLPDVVFTDLPSLKNKGFQKGYVAGVARHIINPSTPQIMGGFGFCGGDPTKCRISEGIHDDISATALVLGATKTATVVVFVGVDIIGLLKFDVDDIRIITQTKLYENLGIYLDPSHIIVASSHSHATPDTSGLFSALDCHPRDEEYITFIKYQIADAIYEAFATLEEVDLDFGLTTFENHDSDVYADDKDLFILRGKDKDGKTVFTFTRWSSHPTCYGSNNNAISADWPGVFRLEIEKELGGMAVFVNGTLGSTYPDKPKPCEEEDMFPFGWQDPDVGKGDHIETACIGKGLAKAAIEALNNSTEITSSEIEVFTQDFKFHPTNKVLFVIAQLAPMPIPYVDVEDPNSYLASTFSLVRIGELHFITTPGEAFPSFGNKIKQAMKDIDPTHIIVVGLAQDWLGYLLTPELWDEKDLSYHQSLSPGQDVLESYIQALHTLIDKGS